MKKLFLLVALTLSVCAGCDEFTVYKNDSRPRGASDYRQLLEMQTDRYEAGIRENTRLAERMASIFLTEYDQMRADLIQSEARHRDSLTETYTTILAILLAVLGLMLYAFIQAVRHPRNMGRGSRRKKAAYQLDDGRVLLVEGGTHELIEPTRSAGLLRGEQGSADPVLMTTIIGCIGLALIVALIAGTNPAPAGSDNSAEIRGMAQQLHADSMAQMDRMVNYLMQSEAAHRQTLRTQGGGSPGIGLISLLIGGFLLFMGGIVAAIFLIRAMQPRNSDFMHVSGPGYREIEARPVERIDHGRVEQIPAERRDLLTHYRFDERGSVAVFLCLGLMMTGLLFLLFSSWMNDRAPAGSAPARMPAQMQTAGPGFPMPSADHTLKTGSIKAVALVFLRNPEGGEPIRALCVYDYGGAVFKIGEDQVGAAMRAIGAGAGKGVLR